MPYLSTVVSARDVTNLKTNLDNWFTANPGVYIRHFQFVAMDQERLNGIEMRCMILYETGAAAPVVPPFTATVLQAGSATAYATAAANAIALAPASLFRGPYSADLARVSRTYDLIGVLLETADTVNGATNWP